MMLRLQSVPTLLKQREEMLSRDRWWALLSADAGKQKKPNLRVRKQKRIASFAFQSV